MSLKSSDLCGTGGFAGQRDGHYSKSSFCKNTVPTHTPKMPAPVSHTHTWAQVAAGIPVRTLPYPTPFLINHSKSNCTDQEPLPKRTIHLRFMPDPLILVFQTKLTTAYRAMEHPVLQVLCAIIGMGAGTPPPVHVGFIVKRTCQRYIVSARRAMENPVV
jgi:hypothetical protein